MKEAKGTSRGIVRKGFLKKLPGFAHICIMKSKKREDAALPFILL
jgi:hypothetical protein